MTDWHAELISRLGVGDAKVAVVGLGYVGLPMCLRALEAGFQVIGIDRDEERLALLKRGGSYLVDVETKEIEAARGTGRFDVSSDYDSLRDSDVVLIAVPTPLAGEMPDLTMVLAAADELSTRLRHGCLVSLESTTYPGTTEDVLRPRLEMAGLRAGTDFALVFSPERIDPGNAQFPIDQIPKIVGGLTDSCSSLGEAFYSRIAASVVVVGRPREAEMAKLLENTYRQVNIALANEFAMVAHELDIDIWEVIDAAATKPFGFHPFYPGVGIGGHCIAVDPVYLTWRIRELGRAPFRLVELAREVDVSMPKYVARRICQTLLDDGIPVEGARVMLLGLTYKPDVDDIRESRALEVFAELQQSGAEVSFHDPFRQEVIVDGISRTGVELVQGLEQADLVAILTHHSSYDWEDIVPRAARVFDARGVTRGIKAPHVKRL